VEKAGHPVIADKILVSWSGGKDAALALHELQQSRVYEITALLTTVTEDYDRVTMHGVRRTLVEQQAEALGLPLHTILVPRSASDGEYADLMSQALQRYLGSDVSGVAFGDIFLHEVRKYREENLAGIGMGALFPLWNGDTQQLARRFIDLGFEAIVTCVDGQQLDGSLVGRTFDERFLSDLPPNVDPCGENGEFHSFVYDGPIFHHPIPVTKGEVVFRDIRFYYCDLLPE